MKIIPLDALHTFIETQEEFLETANSERHQKCSRAYVR